MVNQKPERAAPIKNSTRVQASIEVGYSYWKLTVYLPAMHFVQNMKKALLKNITLLKDIWKNDHEILIKLYSKIPIEQRKKFIKTLVDEMRQSLEIYFEKDQFFLSVLNAFRPDGMAYISEREAEEAYKAATAQASNDDQFVEESDDSVVEISDVNEVEKEVEGMRNRNKNSTTRKKSSPNLTVHAPDDPNNNVARSVKTIGRAPAPAVPDTSGVSTDADGKMKYMYLDRYFEEIDSILQKFTSIAVITAENLDDLDPDMDEPTPIISAEKNEVGNTDESEISEIDMSSTEQTKEPPSLKARKELLRVFLEIVRGLVVVMFLHQFLKRYPVDPTDNGNANSILFRFFGDKATRVVKALRFAVLSGLAMVVGMTALQYMGVFEESFWATV